MRLSSGFGVSALVGRSVAQHGVQDVDAAAGEREDGLVVGVSLGAFEPVEGLAVGVAERAERRLEEDALEGLVAAVGAFEVAELAGLLEDWCQAGRGGELVGGREAFDAACL